MRINKTILLITTLIVLSSFAYGWATVDDYITIGDYIINASGDTNMTNLLIAGHLGIGPVSPLYPLHINSSEDTLASFLSSDANAYIYLADSDTTSATAFARIGDDLALIPYAASGNVGIGTDSPSSKLQVEGDSLTSLTTDGLAYAYSEELTISGGSITVNGSFFSIDTQGDASEDDLDCIVGGSQGNFIMFRTENDARDVELKHNNCGDQTNRILLAENRDMNVSSRQNMIVCYYPQSTKGWQCTNAKGREDLWLSNLGGTVNGDIILNSTATNQIFLPQNNDASNPTIAFSEGDTGIYESGADQISFTFGGSRTFYMDNSKIAGDATNGPAMLQEEPSTTNPVWSFIDDYDTGIGRKGGDNLTFITGGTLAMYIDESQNVAVGAVSPAAKLDVSGLITADNDVWLGDIEDVVGESTEALFIYANGSVANARMGYLGMRNNGLLDVGIEMLENNSGGNGEYISFLLGASSQMILLNNGNLGLGVTDPEEELEISAQIPTIQLTDEGAGGTFELGSMQVGDEYTIKVDGSNVMHFDGDANVGIRTTDPKTPLHVVANDSSIAMRLEENSGGEFYEMKLHSEGDLIFEDDDGSDVFTLEDGGQVGIGMSEPTTKFEILNGGDSDLILRVDGADTASEYIGFGIQPNEGIITAGATGSPDNDLVFRTSDGGTETERMRLYSDGNLSVDTDTLFVDASNDRVGIGTATPSYDLHVVDTYLTSYFRSTNGASILTLDSNNAEAELVLDADGTNVDPFIQFRLEDSNKFAMGVDDSNSDEFRISDGNDVSSDPWFRIEDAIGHVIIPQNFTASSVLHTDVDNNIVYVTATSPQLYVEDTDTTGSSARGQIKFVDNVGTTNSIFGQRSTTGNTYVSNEQDGNVELWAGGNQILTVNSSGYVGIGDTSPEYPLSVYATEPYISVYDTDGSISWLFGQSLDDGLIKTQSSVDRDFVFTNSGSGDVEVGINTADPTEALDVDGNIQTNGYINYTGGNEVNGLNITAYYPNGCYEGWNSTGKHFIC